MPTKTKKFQHANYLWDDTIAGQLDPVERLRYRSNILGADQRITNTGGGNTSSKVRMTDPLSGKEVDVLWVKGSGGDLRTSTRANFASLYMDKFLSLENIYNRALVKGVKTEIEDALVEMYRHTTFGLNPAASSIDTPLHGLIPFRHVDHMHPVSVIAIAACASSIAQGSVLASQGLYVFDDAFDRRGDVAALENELDPFGKNTPDLAARIDASNRIIAHIRIEIQLIDVPHRIGLHEPSQLGRIHPRLVVPEPELRDPRLSGVSEAHRMTAEGFAPGVVGLLPRVLAGCGRPCSLRSARPRRLKAVLAPSALRAAEGPCVAERRSTGGRASGEVGPALAGC